MVAFSCGEKANEATSESSTGSGTTSSGTTVDVSSTDVPTGSTTESSGSGSSGSGSATDTLATTGPQTSTGSESSAGDSTSGTTGGLVVVDGAVVGACAPDDGPAVELRLGLSEPLCDSKWSDEQLRIVLFTGAPLAPGVYPLDGGFGFATRQGVDDPDFISGMMGSVTIESWDGAGVVGGYSVTFEDASVREGGFTGPFCDEPPLCG
jgi:hypothetical protein